MLCCHVVFAVNMASAEVTDVESSEHVQKAPRRRKCKNHLVQLAEMFPDVTYHVAATYGSPEDQIYVMEANIGGLVVAFFIFQLNCIVGCIEVSFCYPRESEGI